MGIQKGKQWMLASKMTLGDHDVRVEKELFELEP